MNQGFSLTDVLVSLLLITSTSLALLKQQWQVSQFVNQLQTRTNLIVKLDNESERILDEKVDFIPTSTGVD